MSQLSQMLDLNLNLQTCTQLKYCCSAVATLHKMNASIASMVQKQTLTNRKLDKHIGLGESFQQAAAAEHDASAKRLEVDAQRSS